MDDMLDSPVVSTDSVVFQLQNSKLAVLLIKRAKSPSKGEWALPGGYNSAGEVTQDAMVRVLRLKAGLDIKMLPLVDQLYTFDTDAVGNNGNAVVVTYMGLGRDIVLKASDTLQSPTFFAVENVPRLPFNHNEIIEYAHKRLAAKLTYTNSVFALLPKFFTLTQLQNAYETILDHKYDKRNFRKKFLSLKMVEPTDKYLHEGAHRPALLYRFRHQKLQTLSRSFD
jgi:8-oxo-dGTP diphosphatase